MASARIKILLKILLLLGTPIAVVAGIFLTGLYLGSERWQQPVLAFESKWLHWELPPHLQKIVEEGKGSGGEGAADPVGTARNSQLDGNNDLAGSVVGGSNDGTIGDRSKQKKQLTNLDSKTEVGNHPANGGGPSSDKSEGNNDLNSGRKSNLSSQEDQGGDGSLDYRSLFAMPTLVRIKVVVDQEFISAHNDWIDYVQRTIDLANQQYQRHFGIELRLHAIGSWAVATAGLSSQQLLEDLRARPRESADVLLGMTARPLDHRIAGKADQAQMDQRFNGAYAVVYSASPADEPHLFGCLHELGHIFGALDIEDPNSLDYQRGSFMSYAPPKKGVASWIDEANRRRILARKGYPFWPESLAMKRAGRP